MKSIALLLCSAALCAAADFTTGQAGRALIGQPIFTAQQYDITGATLGGLSGIAYANGQLFVADSNRFGSTPDNNRVLRFNTSVIPDPRQEIPPNRGRCPVCVGEADLVLGQKDFTTGDLQDLSASTFFQPTAVATDGRRLVVADTNFNRVLIWTSMPTNNGQAADLVLGQVDLTTAAQLPRLQSTQKSLRGPQGVWIQGERLFVADTQNHRIMIWTTFPTQNNQNADIVLGFPDFTGAKEGLIPEPTQTSLLNPVSVSSDGTRLFVADLGNNRVLIWNNINDLSNNRPADIVIGQPDFTSSDANNSPKLCESNGTGDDGEPTYPGRCATTLNFPRFALSDGTRLFIADGGNDRVLVYNQIPTTQAAAADAVLGQLSMTDNRISGSDETTASAADSVRAPSSLAWDGSNLYVGDTFNRRVLVFSAADRLIPNTGIRNAASLNVYAVGSIALSGTLKTGDKIVITIGNGNEDTAKDYTYEITSDDTFGTVLRNLVNLINADGGDPLVLATPNETLLTVILTAREGGEGGNSVTYSVVMDPENSTVTPAAGGANLSGGQDAAKIGPYSLISVLGENLSDSTAAAPAGKTLPYELANVQVYIDGMRAPLLYVSPTLINAQLPVEVNDADSVSAYVRIRRNNGDVEVSTPIGMLIVPQNPGIFTSGGDDPRPAIAMHGSSYATGTIQIDGAANAGDTATVIVEGRSYIYTVKQGDTLETIRDGLIALINSNSGESVVASAGGSFTRIRLRAKVEGPAGQGISYSASADDSAQVVMTAISSALCCANVAGSLLSEDNPAVPGETIYIWATGLGLVRPQAARDAMITGQTYEGPENSEPNEFVSALAGSKTANVISAGLKPGTFGIYEVVLELNSDIPTNPLTQLTIAQNIYVSNIVTIPVFNPAGGN